MEGILPDNARDHRDEYARLVPVAMETGASLVAAVTAAVERQGVRLASPVEFRVKDWPSVERKIARGAGGVREVHGLQDLIGIRLVVPFMRDLRAVRLVLGGLHQPIRRYEPTDRLGGDRFGYRADHYVIGPIARSPGGPASVPLLAEVQVRTAAQHVWAVASHVLQYKQPESIPAELRRAVNRVAALLEMVDDELERVLVGRDGYRAGVQLSNDETELNVDILALALPQLWGSEHAQPGEPLMPWLTRSHKRISGRSANSAASSLSSAVQSSRIARNTLWKC